MKCIKNRDKSGNNRAVTSARLHADAVEFRPLQRTKFLSDIFQLQKWIHKLRGFPPERHNPARAGVKLWKPPS